MQTTLLGFAIALILALLAALIGPYFVNWNDHRAFFEGEATKLIGVPVRVGGNIDVAMLPSPSMTLRDIVIGPDTSGLRARSLRVELGLGPLLRGEVRATEMRLVAPQVSLAVDRNGQIDWPALALSADTLSIDKLSIEDGRATLADATSQSRLVLDKLWFSGDVRSLTGPVRGRGEFTTGGTLYSYDIGIGRGGPDGARAKLSLKTDESPLTFDIDGQVSVDVGAPRFDGSFVLARPAGAVLASGKAVAYEPWRLASKVKASPGTASFDEVSFQYGPDERAAALTGSAVFDLGAQPRLKGMLSARQIDLDRLLATPDTPRRLPLAAVQAFGDMLGSALRPSWPVNVSINVDAMNIGGAVVQNVASDLRSEGDGWMLDRLELRAPGFTQIKLNGRIYPIGKGLGFTGATTIDSNDPKNLAGWIAGKNSSGVQMKPWRAAGDVTLSADRIAVERLQTEFGRGPIEGSVVYIWSGADRPARLDANLRAAEFDVDAALSFGVSALSGLGLEAPREVALGLEFDRVRLATLEARNVTARLTIDRNGVAIERLSIVDFGNAGIVASGRIDTSGSPGGNIALDLDARDLAGIISLAESYAPIWAEPLRRLSKRQSGLKLQAKVSIGNASGGTTGKLDVTGRVGDARVKVAASATGKSDSFSPTNLRLLAETDLRVEGALEADEPTTLLALFGLERLSLGDPRSARLSLTAQGPPSRDFRFDATLSAGPIDAVGKGTFRVPDNESPQLDLDRIAGTISGRKVQGKLALRFGNSVSADGSIEADTIDVAGTIAAAIGMPAARAGSGWPTEPLALNTAGLTGRIEFKSQRAAFSPTIVVQQLRGVARIAPSEIVFDDVAGELAKGRFEGRLAFAAGADGITTRARVTVRNAEAGALFVRADEPVVSGRLSAQVEVEGAGRSPAAFMGSLAGFGTVTLEQGQVAGIYPGVFEAMNRALELGMPTNGNRVRDFVSGVLDGTKVAVPRATATISVNSGQARFNDIAIRSTGADVEAVAGINLLDATLAASVTLAGPPAGAGKPRPSMRIALQGPVMAPERSVDIGALMHWLTLQSAEQQARQIDAMERAAREAAAAEAAAAEAKRVRDSAAAQPQAAASFGSEGTSALPETRPGDTAPAVQPPVTPPAVEAPPMPRPRVAPRPERAPLRLVDPPGLVGAQP